MIRGWMGGRTAKVVSPTRPRVVECRAVGLMGRLSFGATMPGGLERYFFGVERREGTDDQRPI